MVLKWMHLCHELKFICPRKAQLGVYWWSLSDICLLWIRSSHVTKRLDNVLPGPSPAQAVSTAPQRESFIPKDVQIWPVLSNLGQDLTNATTVCVCDAPCRVLRGFRRCPLPSSYGGPALGLGHVPKEPAHRWKLLHPHLCSRYHPIFFHLFGSSWTLLSTPHIFLCPEVDSWIVQENEKFGPSVHHFLWKVVRPKESDLKLNLYSGYSQRRKTGTLNNQKIISCQNQFAKI